MSTLATAAAAAPAAVLPAAVAATADDHTRTIETLHFDNLVLRTLPIDKETKNFIREVPGQRPQKPRVR